MGQYAYELYELDFMQESQILFFSFSSSSNLLRQTIVFYCFKIALPKVHSALFDHFVLLIFSENENESERKLAEAVITHG